MQNKITKESILQIIIFSACLLVLLTPQPEISVQGQAGCNGPPLTNANYPTDYAWLQGATISVLIFDTPDPVDFQIIDEGIRK